MLFIKKIIDYFIWVMFFVFLLLAIIIYFFNNTYPGDYLYTFKQNFENFVLRARP